MKKDVLLRGVGKIDLFKGLKHLQSEILPHLNRVKENMLKSHVRKQVKKELESLGERVGNRIAQGVAKRPDSKGGEIGRKAGKAVGDQIERLHDAIDNETVTKQEELGIGGKLGTGLGIIGKHIVEKRYSLLGRLMGSGNMVSEGRTMGAKAEKIFKRAVRSGVERIAGAKGVAKQDDNKGTS